MTRPPTARSCDLQPTARVHTRLRVHDHCPGIPRLLHVLNHEIDAVKAATLPKNVRTPFPAPLAHCPLSGAGTTTATVPLDRLHRVVQSCIRLAKFKALQTASVDATQQVSAGI